MLILQSGTDTFLLPKKHFFLLHGLTYNDKIIKSKEKREKGIACNMIL